MPDRVKEKLVELQMQAPIGWTKGEFADYLIAHGVTVQEECNACATATQEVFTSLQGKIAELSKAQEWISVKDRLPEDSTYVLARLSGGAIYEALCLTKGSKQWCAINREHFVNKDTVTHWMPLPQPPKGE